MSLLRPHAALQGMLRPATTAAPATSSLLVAGAGGSLGNEVAHRLLGRSRYRPSTLLLRSPLRMLLSHVHGWQLPQAEGSAPWLAAPTDTTAQAQTAVAATPTAQLLPRADVAVMMFEPPRLYRERERALWTPTPQQAAALAQWLHACCGTHTLAVVMPHASGLLPVDLLRGLANLDEQALAATGFTCLLIIRALRDADPQHLRHPLQRLARALLQSLRYMLPAGQRPLRPSRLAVMVDAALAHAPPGVWVLPPDLLHSLPAGQEEAALQQWFARQAAPGATADAVSAP